MPFMAQITCAKFCSNQLKDVTTVPDKMYMLQGSFPVIIGLNCESSRV